MTHLWAPGRRCPSPRQGRRRGARPWGEEKGAGRARAGCSRCRQRASRTPQARGQGARQGAARRGQCAGRTLGPAGGCTPSAGTLAVQPGPRPPPPPHPSRLGTRGAEHRLTALAEHPAGAEPWVSLQRGVASSRTRAGRRTSPTGRRRVSERGRGDRCGDSQQDPAGRARSAPRPHDSGSPPGGMQLRGRPEREPARAELKLAAAAPCTTGRLKLALRLPKPNVISAVRTALWPRSVQRSRGSYPGTGQAWGFTLQE